ncbi:hypothetical protein H9Q74_014329 [Fusarium xylarioides]|nr:hypothetical protein H9Q71_014219 [Fusarium xylarioides]KAG5809028.1 hypothetical protein H9Q74_014329 [Fusarium xylarioides]
MEETQYNGQAYTFSLTYHDGYPKLYAHHVTAPTTEEGQPEYHITQLRSFASEEPLEAYEEASSPHELHGSVDPSDYVALQDADDALQQHIADASHYSENSSEETPIPHYLDADADSQEPSQELEAPGFDNPSFTSSFTSSFSTAKRPRQSLSPPSNSRGSLSKSQKRPNTARRTAESSISATGSVRPGSGESHWVETYGRNGKVYFTIAEGKELKTETKDWMEETAADGTQCFYWQSPVSG